jgi:hypothetical protein
MHRAFVAWLTGDFRAVLDDREILDRFVAFTELTPARAKAYVTGGTFTPVLFASDLGPIWGMFKPQNPLMVFIHEQIVAAVEARPADPLPKTFATAKILQELVHCGRAEIGLDQVGDPGAQFEAETFGTATGRQLFGRDYLPLEFIPTSLRGV